MIEAYVHIAFQGMKSRKVRSWLTLLGIVIGIASVTALISLGQGVDAALQEQFEIIGGDKLIILPGSGEGIAGFISSTTTASKLTEKDLDLIERTPGIKSTFFYILGSGTLLHKGEAYGGWVMGIPSDERSELLTQTQGYEPEFGRLFKESDRYGVLVGYDLWATDMVFSKPIRLRDTITINNQAFRVVGLMSKVGNPQDDRTALIPEDAAREMFNKPDQYDGIFAQVSPGIVPAQMVEILKEKLRDLRDVKEGEEDFVIETSENLIKQVGAIIAIVQAVFIGVGGISLVVGGVGIMNTMYTSVLERTREIGIMKAVGAKNNQILFVFLIESGLYGLVGGLIGGLSGIEISKLFELAIRASGSFEIFKVNFSPLLLLGVLTFSFFVGVISGVLPAKQAAELQPVDALRYE
ncbi:hypothetical protein COT72_05595 [archaeon CG10_big_fil_rev_8_21_14_0_10_43_11]|nr:MAG: hypothetical protein COT72_05595 [archaeon CG10_big_fil_rev_8_21_14_0_10_43_11]